MNSLSDYLDQDIEKLKRFVSRIFNFVAPTIVPVPEARWVAPKDHLTPPENSIMGYDRNRDMMRAAYDVVRRQSALDPEGKYHTGVLLEFDVMNLGMINRLYGQEAGDMFLKLAGQWMGNYLKYYNERSYVNYLYHSGGDEFAIVLGGNFALEPLRDVFVKGVSLFEEYIVIKNGLHQIPHHKHAAASGAGVTFRIHEIKGDSPDYDEVSEKLHNEMAEEKETFNMCDVHTTWSNGSASGKTSVAAYDSETLCAEVMRMINMNLGSDIEYSQILPDKILMPERREDQLRDFGSRAEETARLSAETPAGVLRVEISQLSLVNRKYGREKANETIHKLAQILREETADLEGCGLYRPSGGAFDIIVTGAVPALMDDLRQRIYVRAQAEIFGARMNDCGVLLTSAAAGGGREARDVFRLLEDTARLQKTHGVAFVVRDAEAGTCYALPVNDTRGGLRGLPAATLRADAEIPFAAALRDGLDADTFHDILLNEPKEASLMLYGAREDAGVAALLKEGHDTARLGDLLRHDVPSVYQELYIDMLARDRLPAAGPDAVMRAYIALKQAAHVYNDPSFLSGDVVEAFTAVYRQRAASFDASLKNAGEKHLAGLWSSIREKDLPAGASVAGKPLDIIATAIDSAAQKIVEKGIVDRHAEKETIQQIPHACAQLRQLRDIVRASAPAIGAAPVKAPSP